jgi:hypothetical protein
MLRRFWLPVHPIRPDELTFLILSSNQPAALLLSPNQLDRFIQHPWLVHVKRLNFLIEGEMQHSVKEQLGVFVKRLPDLQSIHLVMHLHPQDVGKTIEMMIEMARLGQSDHLPVTNHLVLGGCAALDPQKRGDERRKLAAFLNQKPASIAADIIYLFGPHNIADSEDFLEFIQQQDCRGQFCLVDKQDIPFRLSPDNLRKVFTPEQAYAAGLLIHKIETRYETNVDLRQHYRSVREALTGDKQFVDFADRTARSITINNLGRLMYTPFDEQVLGNLREGPGFDLYQRNRPERVRVLQAVRSSCYDYQYQSPSLQASVNRKLDKFWRQTLSLPNGLLLAEKLFKL